MLHQFFRPKGVAIIGASRNPHKLGYGVVRNLLEYHYKGPIYPINEIATEILGLRCYPRISDVPDPVDLAIIVVPSPLVKSVIKECGDRGIRHVIIVSGGFRETGAKGKKLELELLDLAKRYEMRVIGPNCIGTIDTHTPVNTTFVVGMPQEGEIGFISQSGAMVAAVIDWARGAGVGFSRIVSLGNQLDVNETEMLSTMVSDRQTQVITAYIEGITDGQAFMKASAEIASHKPVIVLKGGHGESGAKAVASHTGAMAGSAKAYDAAFEKSGVLRANTMEELFDWARALAWQPLPKGNRVAVLTNAGGPAILAVDTFEAAGLQMAELTSETKSYLQARLPAAASIRNPVDVLAGSGPGTYAVALDALLSDPTVDAVHVIQAPQDWFLPESLAEVVGEVAAVHHKPVLASFMGLASVEKALSILHKRHIPNFAFPERAASALSAMIRRKRWLDRPIESEVHLQNIDARLAQKAVKEADFSKLVSAYNIKTPDSGVATNIKDALHLAKKIGYPVVMKLVSKQVIHKSDVGGVVLNINDEATLKTAYDKLHDITADHDIDGVLIQKMLKLGYEIIVGFKRDPQFGPMILVGSGGTDVELLEDIRLGMAPLTRQQAEGLLDETLIGRKMKGWRKSPAGDRNDVIEAMLRMSRISLDFPEIVEMEINPLIAYEKGKGAFAIDIRGKLSE